MTTKALAAGGVPDPTDPKGGKVAAPCTAQESMEGSPAVPDWRALLGDGRAFGTMVAPQPQSVCAGEGGSVTEASEARSEAGGASHGRSCHTESPQQAYIIEGILCYPPNRTGRQRGHCQHCYLIHPGRLWHAPEQRAVGAPDPRPPPVSWAIGGRGQQAGWQLPSHPVAGWLAGASCCMCQAAPSST